MNTTNQDKQYQTKLYTEHLISTFFDSFRCKNAGYLGTIYIENVHNKGIYGYIVFLMFHDYPVSAYKSPTNRQQI